MLFEKNAYLDDFPISIRIMHIEEYPLHYHQDIELVYVLQGTIELKNGYHNYILKDGDIFTNSGHEVHGLYSTGTENTVAVIQISNRFFTQYFPELQKVCFRTYVNDDIYDQLDTLRKMLLRILMDYSMKNFDYKSLCINAMIDVIEYLHEFFNLFAFENQIVVNFKSNNPIIVQRISRIISYVYENHSEKITLKELADREHLSTYYLSHLIHNYMGISFHDFLCFARSEMSEIPLLETRDKISTVARNSGFSTTAYYETCFTKWFGHSPSAHRQKLQSKILSSAYGPRFTVPSDYNLISIIRNHLSLLCDQDSNTSSVQKMKVSVQVDGLQSSSAELHHQIQITVTPEDCRIMYERLPFILKDLQPDRLYLSVCETDTPSDIEKALTQLRNSGYSAEITAVNGLKLPSSSGWDTVSAAIQIFKDFVNIPKKIFSFHLRDQGDVEQIMKGAPSLFTSAMIPKPSYYALRLLRNADGELLHKSRHEATIRTGNKNRPGYILTAFQFNDMTDKLCLRNTGIHETDHILNEFRDELHIDFHIQLPVGKYTIIKYSLSHENSIFSHMKQLGFPSICKKDICWMQLLNTASQVQVYTETADKYLDVSFTLYGADILTAVIQPVC